VFTIEYRDRVRDRVVEMATADRHVVAGAVVGSLALGVGDAWSDLDLMFAVVDGVPISDVLGRWTRSLADEFDALHLFDLPSGAILYRVYLLPGGLQLDLSCVPASDFGPAGPRFRLLFGQSVIKPQLVSRSAQELFGWAAAYARDSRACIERHRWWQAEHCINGIRNNALALACLRHDLPTAFGRGFDDLPPDVLAPFDSVRVRSLQRDELLRALTEAVEALLRESNEIKEMATKAAPRIRAWLPQPTPSAD
jgi:hypothetical protein